MRMWHVLIQLTWFKSIEDWHGTVAWETGASRTRDANFPLMDWACGREMGTPRGMIRILVWPVSHPAHTALWGVVEADGSSCGLEYDSLRVSGHIHLCMCRQLRGTHGIGRMHIPEWMQALHGDDHDMYPSQTRHVAESITLTVPVSRDQGGG